ncbi:MAG: cyclodeaminase/cyclohydrolase family protein [Ignavibacteriales bacterium]|nr:cyclodeaminase/cyclohydrolase family protein [Ignavibacteriales bacterium]
MNLSKTLQEYFNELSSNSPTPGGGNVAALCGTLSSSLGIMVCNLTIGKKKYADVELQMINLKDNLEKIQKKFIELGQQDNASFDKVMDAFKLPKETEQEKNIRSKAIEEATIGATSAPMDVIQTSKALLPILEIIIDKGNKNSISDAGVAAALVGTAAKGAYLNVLINCSSLSNQTIAAELEKTADILIEEITLTSDRLVEQVVKVVRTK